MSIIVIRADLIREAERLAKLNPAASVKGRLTPVGRSLRRDIARSLQEAYQKGRADARRQAVPGSN